MRTIGFLFLLALGVVACNNPANKTDENSNDTIEKQEVIVDNNIKSCNGLFVDTVINNLELFVGQEISVCGTATHVCMHSGDKLFLSPCSDSEEALIVMANKDLKTFDQELLGKHVMVSGIMVKAEDDAVETHHDHEVTYYLECSKVHECTCKADSKGCCKKDTAKCCKDKDGAHPCKDTTQKRPCNGHNQE